MGISDNIFKEKHQKTLIIAEAGINHNADLKLAMKLVDAALDSGADIVKFQIAVPNLMSTGYAKKAKYQLENTNGSEMQLEMIRDLLLTTNEFKKVYNYCSKKGIECFFTAFDLESLSMVSSWGQNYFKVPSGEITNYPLLRNIASLDKPILLSTGMSNLSEIEEAIDVLTNFGVERQNITVLHCNTSYPTKMHDVNLLAMTAIQKAFNVKVGYSDHTLGIEVPIAAVSIGACVIEKHLTLDREMKGPDHKASLEPEEFYTMVRKIRNIETALGNGLKLPTPSELPNKSVARKSIVAAGPIRKGEVFSEQNLASKRPGTGISPMRWTEVLGSTATRDYEIDEQIVI